VNLWREGKVGGEQQKVEKEDGDEMVKDWETEVREGGLGREELEQENKGSA